MTRLGYSHVVDRALDAACSAVPLTDADFVALALACLDQAGVDATTQRKVSALVGDPECDRCGADLTAGPAIHECDDREPAGDPGVAAYEEELPW